MQGLTDLWQEFDLPGTQRLLDDLATSITTRWRYYKIYRNPICTAIMKRPLDGATTLIPNFQAG